MVIVCTNRFCLAKVKEMMKLIPNGVTWARVCDFGFEYGFECWTRQNSKFSTWENCPKFGYDFEGSLLKRLSA